MFDSSMVNEPSGFEPQKFYCNKNGLDDPKEICTMVKYGETCQGCHLAIYISCSEVKRKSKRLPSETKNTQKTENQRLGFIKALHIEQCSSRAVYAP